jgi:glutamate dehydrogenase/leucine dehydrogenase
MTIELVGTTLGVVERDDELADAGHELVVVSCRNVDSAPRGLIAVADTAPGPAVGGTRSCPHAHEEGLA